MLLLTGCAEESTATIVQVAALTPTPASTMPSTSNPVSSTFCRPSDLLAISLWEKGGTGLLDGVIVFTNQSRNACVVRGKPTQIEFMNAKGLVMFTTAPMPENSVAEIILRPGEKANVALVWSNWCREIDDFSLKISLTGGTGQITAPSVATNNVPAFRGPACNSTQLPTYLEIGQFQAGSGNSLAPTATAYSLTQAAYTTPVNWATLTAVSIPTPRPIPTLPSNIPLCQAANLKATAEFGAATGSLGGSVFFVNQTKQPCTLENYAQLRLVDAKGIPLKVEYNKPEPPTGRGIVLQPGIRARIFWSWSNWCKEPPGDGVKIVVTLLRNQGELTVPVIGADRLLGGKQGGVPRCDRTDVPSGMGANGFELVEQ